MSYSRRCYCAFCRSERVVYRKRHVASLDVALSAAASALAMVLMWQDLDPRALVLFAIFLGFAELFIQLRWRLTIACTKCGFDPVLYKRDPQKAAERVKNHLARRAEDPLTLFAPPLDLPVIKKTRPKDPTPGSDSRNKA